MASQASKNYPHGRYVLAMVSGRAITAHQFHFSPVLSSPTFTCHWHLAYILQNSLNIQFFDGEIVVGVHANITGDGQCFFGDLSSIQLRIFQ